MKKDNNLKMVKKFLVVALLILSIASISAFCVTQGYILDEDNNQVNASKINIVCRRGAGEIIYVQPYGIAYGFPFGDWYDDCTYCDQGIYINVVNDNFNLYGEVFNVTCNKIMSVCYTNISMRQISEPVSTKDYYDAPSSVGSTSPTGEPMPKSNESPQTKVKGIREEPLDYTYLYVIGGIVFVIILILIINALKKHGK